VTAKLPHARHCRRSDEERTSYQTCHPIESLISSTSASSCASRFIRPQLPRSHIPRAPSCLCDTFVLLRRSFRLSIRSFVSRALIDTPLQHR